LRYNDLRSGAMCGTGYAVSLRQDGTTPTTDPTIREASP
jgi:hypothetical protein